MTPSTSGLRAALKREDVEFSLPLYTPRQEEEASGGVPETDSTTEFLESLGIEADSLPGLTGAAPKHRLAAGIQLMSTDLQKTYDIRSGQRRQH